VIRLQFNLRLCLRSSNVLNQPNQCHFQFLDPWPGDWSTWNLQNSFELFICAGAWGWLNFSSWFSSILLKKYRHLKSKILHKCHRWLLVFLAFLTSFFSYFTYPKLSKILNIFMVVYSTNYRFYQRILKSFWIFIKKNRDIWNTKHFQNFIVY